MIKSHHHYHPVHHHEKSWSSTKDYIIGAFIIVSFLGFIGISAYHIHVEANPQDKVEMVNGTWKVTGKSKIERDPITYYLVGIFGGLFVVSLIVAFAINRNP